MHSYEIIQFFMDLFFIVAIFQRFNYYTFISILSSFGLKFEFIFAQKHKFLIIFENYSTFNLKIAFSAVLIVKFKYAYKPNLMKRGVIASYLRFCFNFLDKIIFNIRQKNENI